MAQRLTQLLAAHKGCELPNNRKAGVKNDLEYLRRIKG